MGKRGPKGIQNKAQRKQHCAGCKIKLSEENANLNGKKSKLGVPMLSGRCKKCHTKKALQNSAKKLTIEELKNRITSHDRALKIFTEELLIRLQ